MLIDKVFERMSKHPEKQKMGMIASHLGLVRATSLDGSPVTAMEVQFDMDVINRIVNEIKRKDGIIEVVIEGSPGRLSVGEEVMAVAVGGDTREHVFPALIEAVDRVKKEATRKREIFEK